MPKYVYGYAWKDAKGAVHKRFHYADSQVEADDEFERVTQLKLEALNVKKNRKPA